MFFSQNSSQKYHLIQNRPLVIFMLLAISSSMIFSFILPFSTAKEKVYVAENASEPMDGSSKHPYDSIQKAIDKASTKDKHVYIQKGTYTENIEIWSKVEVYGSGRDEVIIKAKDKDKEVVEMHHKTKIKDVTIQNGENGVEVEEGSKAMILECKIKDNDKDGVNVEKAKINNKKILEIYDSIIENNGWNGIYSQERKFVVSNNQILNNKKDGIEFKSGSEGTISNNGIKKNDGDGIKLTLDNSGITVKKNTIRDSERDGIEIRSKGGGGHISIRKNKFYENDRWAISKNEKQPFNNWDQDLYIKDDNIFRDNEYGNVSPVIKNY